MAINGTDTAETLAGTLGDDVIDARGGNDTLLGSQGNDSVDGGAGTDRLTFTLADAALFAAAAGARNYTIGASSVTDASGLLNTSFTGIENITFSTVGAGDFDDTIDASGFNGTGLTIALGNGATNVIGSGKSDIINTGRGDNVVNAGLSNDNIIASHGADTLNGEGGIDRVTLNLFNTSLFDAATGSRTYIITTSSLTDSSGTLNSVISEIERITFSSAGTGDFGEILDASGFVAPLTGAFVLNATLGNGPNTVTGTNQNDFITTGSGDDQIGSGAGNDTLALGAGSNWADAGTGFDFAQATLDNSGGSVIYISGSGGTVQVTIDGVVTNTVLNVEEFGTRYTMPNAAVTTVDASGLTGLSGLLYLDDTDGSTISIGHAGLDYFVGNSTYTLGNDVYTGNGGADIYDYTWAVNAMDGDTITDFDPDDVIDLRSNTPTQNSGGLLANQFIGMSAFSNIAGQYRYFVSGGQTFLQVDHSGDGLADETLTIANGQFGLVETAAGSNILMRANLVQGDNFGNLSLRGSLGSDVIYGYDQPDRLYASQGNDFLDGGTFNDRLQVNLWDTTLFAAQTGDRSYTITNTRFTDSSGLINTTMTSMERLTFSSQGLNFNDTINVSGWVSGAPNGIVTLLLGNGNNNVTGSQYDDFISAGSGQNVIDGGAGNDTAQLRFDNGGGNVLIVTGSGGSLSANDPGFSAQTLISVENVTLTGSDFNSGSTIDASGLTGFAGILGFGDTNGSNICIGHSGTDLFINGHPMTVGNDTYTGNGGADIYDYTFAVNGMDGDTITDFDPDDIIDLRFNTPTQNGGGLLANQFIGNFDFSGTAGEYRFFAEGGQTFVQVDHSGDGVADETLTIANGQFALGLVPGQSNQLQIYGLAGTAGNDSYVGTLGNDNYYGFGGFDTVGATSGMDFLFGGEGWDQLRFVTGDTTRFSTATGSRTFTITNEWVGASDGSINTYHSEFELLAIHTTGTGDYGDTIDASALTSANLVLRLGTGDDTVISGAGDDNIGLGLGSNSADGGDGYDVIFANFDSTGGATAYITNAGGTVLATVNGSVVATFANCEELHIEGINGGGGATVIDASGFIPIAGVALVLRDSNGDDIIIGSSGADYLANVSTHVLGVDTFTGNGGADVFDWTFASDGINGDVVTDFDDDDTLDFRFNDGTIAGASPLLVTNFIGANAFSGAAGEYRFSQSGGATYVEFDTNGDTIADQVLTLSNGQYGLVETAPGSNVLAKATLYNGTGADEFRAGTLGNDVINMGGGKDTVAATQGTDVVDGGAGGLDQINVLMFRGDRFEAPTGSRTYTLTSGSLTDSSGTLNTSLAGVERIAFYTNGAGDFGDTVDLSGFAAAAGTWTSFVRLGNGDDIVIGSAGDDDIGTGLGINSVDAGDGFDFVTANFDNDLGATAYVTMDGGAVITTLNGVVVSSVSNGEWVAILGANANAGVTTVDASGLTGFTGLLLFGDNNGSNISIGSAGSDMFTNGHGLEAGNDVYTGNGGADIYDYTWAVGAMDGDTITDFDADDIIDLQFNNPTYNGGGLTADKFIGNAAFSGVAGQYRYFASGGKTYVQVDHSGDGTADETLTIANGQFVLAETSAGSNQLKIVGQVVTGNGANNALEGTSGDDFIYGLGGRDTIYATQGNDYADGGPGNDTFNVRMWNGGYFPNVSDAPHTYVLTNNSISAAGTGLNSTFVSMGTVILSLAGTSHGDTVDSTAFTGGFAFRAIMGDGDDTFIGGTASDDVATGHGYDVLDMGGGADVDTARVNIAPGATQVSITGSGDTAEVYEGGVLRATISGAEYISINEPLDTFAVDGLTHYTDASGYTGLAQVIHWDHNGDDVMLGSTGRDIFANLYNATVGNDTYTGNGGADIFDYTVAINALNNDVITDLDADDIIDFQFNDGVAVPGQLLCNQWLGNGPFTNVAGQYRYAATGGKTYVEVDTDGNGSADRVLTIANGQFVLAETAPGSNQLKIVGQYVTGTAANDSLHTSLGNDIVYGEGGNDIIFGSQGTDFVDGGAGGGDRLVFLAFDATKLPPATGSRSYVVTANSVTDSSGLINTSFTGIERVNINNAGGTFGDAIDVSGFVTNPNIGVVVVLTLGNGNDTVVGSNYADDIKSGLGNNLINAGGGNDFLSNQFGQITADGGAGADRLTFTVDCASGGAVVLTSAGNTLLLTVGGVTSSATSFEDVVVYGVGAGTMTIDASGLVAIPGQSIALYGHDGTDIILGSAGSDFFANSTTQVLGFDRFTGNGGADTFDYTYAADSMNNDTITDLDADDVIDFRNNSLGQFESPLRCDKFIGNAAFGNVAGQYRYRIDGSRTLIELDSDGDGTADQTLTIANGAFVMVETSVGSNILRMATAGEELEGVVADGYLADATLFIDLDGDRLLDAGEAWTKTDSEGNFTLNVNQVGTLVAFGGTSIDTGLANGMVLAGPTGSSVINPLTTLVQAVIDESNGAIGAAAAQTRVLAAFGLDPTLDLMNVDLLAQGADPDALAAQKAAAQIANLVAATEGAAGSEALLIDALAELIATPNATVDLTDAATLTPLLGEALPASADLANIVAEAVIEGDAIAAATSLDGISDAQAAGQTLDYGADNHFIGTSADDHLRGLGGNDTLDGLAGNDRLEGGTGDDVLDGGLGLDRLWGGSGADRFVFTADPGRVPTKMGAMSLDVIYDFGAGDLIDLSQIDANAFKDGHQLFTWRGTNSNKLAGDLSIKVYDSVQGAERALGYDIDGVSGASPYSGPVTLLLGNTDGGTPDFAIALIGVAGLSQGQLDLA